MLDKTYFEDKLKARRAHLNAALHRYEASLDQPRPKDFEDAATERENDEVIEALGSRGLDEIRRIDAALARIAHGDYGVCARCGEDISEARLEIVPDAATCCRCG